MDREVKVVRNLDSLGRLVIPIEIRREMGISTGDPVQMKVNGERVIVERFAESCLLCGETGHIFEVKNGKKMCKKCLKEIKERDFLKK